ncbi:MAG: 5-(carboxyamino)imidazole ribonucleotide synthase [Bacteroidia bacterium]|jgi:5-(carboxyamino)imidazole ribonucleotide synthase
MTQPFKQTIGIVGGGQLGKMLVESSAKWNVNFRILDPTLNAPAARYASHFIQGSLTAEDKIRELAEGCDVLTYEIEHINCDVLASLEAEGKTVVPASKVLRIIQDKGLQKQFYLDHKIPTAAFKLMQSVDFEQAALKRFTGDSIVVKACQGGYDGKGVAILNKADATKAIIQAQFNGQILLENYVPNAIELAVIVGRSTSGQITCFPVVEMYFDPVKNLVDYLFSPANISEEQRKTAVDLATKTANALNSPGLFAVEMFLTQEGEILVNEVAPRPHNSGHHTIEACVTSQYEQLMRILLDLPLGSTHQLHPAVMTNILGAEDVNGNYQLTGLKDFHLVEGSSLHWYNKEHSKPGRKMGHFTVVDVDLKQAIQKAQALKGMLKMVAK